MDFSLGNSLVGEVEKRDRLSPTDLVKEGWQPIDRVFDLEHFLWVVASEPKQIAMGVFDLIATYAGALSHNDRSPFFSFLSLFNKEYLEKLDYLWSLLTLPPEPVYGKNNSFRVLVRYSYDGEDGTWRSDLAWKVIARAKEVLGVPDHIYQDYLSTKYYFPKEKFQSWDNLSRYGDVIAVWNSGYGFSVNRGVYQLFRYKEEVGLPPGTLDNLAVSITGSSARIGGLSTEHFLASYTNGVCGFTEECQKRVASTKRTGILVHGRPGTGKSAWALSFASEVLAPLGYVTFILDYKSAADFTPPSYIPRYCLIINDADNLAVDRSGGGASNGFLTERMLSLLDGTTAGAVTMNGEEHSSVVIVTCNTIERLDDAFLRKGRIDLIHEFTHQYI